MNQKFNFEVLYHFGNLRMSASRKSPEFRRKIGRFWTKPPKSGENSENRRFWEPWRDHKKGSRTPRGSRERELSIETQTVCQEQADGSSKIYKETVTRTRVEDPGETDPRQARTTGQGHTTKQVARLYTIGEARDRPASAKIWTAPVPRCNCRIEIPWTRGWPSP